jgi:hypothetical protein
MRKIFVILMIFTVMPSCALFEDNYIKAEKDYQKRIDDFDNQIEKIKEDLNKKNIPYLTFTVGSIDGYIIGANHSMFIFTREMSYTKIDKIAYYDVFSYSRSIFNSEFDKLTQKITNLHSNTIKYEPYDFGTYYEITLRTNGEEYYIWATDEDYTEDDVKQIINSIKIILFEFELK